MVRKASWGPRIRPPFLWLFAAMIASSVCAAAAQASVRHYVAQLHQAGWQVAKTPLKCSLSHDIPLYGRATFERQAGSGLGFRLDHLRQPVTRGVANLASIPPEWMHEAIARPLGQAPIMGKATLLKLKSDIAWRMLNELEAGMFPTIDYQVGLGHLSQVRVALSAVKVREPLEEFLQCLTELLPYQFKDVQFSSLLFPFASAELTATTRARLDILATYIINSPDVRQATITGHTDNIGFRRYNQRLGQQRAESVRDYLSSRGVKDVRLKIVSYGERRPKYSNRKESGRAKNRRVSVTLQK